MSDRRRFFPAKRVQQVPGKSAELEVQLRPQSAPAGGQCACDVLGALVLTDFVVNYYGDASAEYLPPKPYVMHDWRMVGMYVIIPYYYWQPVRKFRAVVAGATLCDVKWSWTLDMPTPWPTAPYGYTQSEWGGVEIEEQNGTLSITILHALDATSLNQGNPWWCELTLRATCGGAPAGTIILRPGINMYTDSLPAFEVPA